MYKNRIIAFFVCICLTIGLVNSSSVNSAKKVVKLSSSKLNVTIGKSKTLKVKNTKKTVKWTVTSGYINVVVVKKGKYSATVTGRVVGPAVIQATVGKKKYTCKVNVVSKAKMATFTEASWSPDRPKPGDVVSDPSSPYPTTPGSSGKSRNGIDDIFYYDLNYTDDSGNLITTEAATTQSKKKPSKDSTTAEDGSTEPDAEDDYEDIEDAMYDEDEGEYDIIDDESEITNTDGRNADDVAAIAKFIELQEGYGIEGLSKNLDSEFYTWEEVVPGSGSERLVGLNLSGLGLIGEFNIDKFFIEAKEYATVDKANPAFSQLVDINVSDNHFTSIVCNKCTKLEKLSIGGNDITSFSISGKKELVDFSCADSEELTSIAITNCVSIESINSNDCEALTKIDLTGDTSIGEINYVDGVLTDLILKNCSALYYLNCSGNKLKSLDLQTCTSLEEVNCSNNNLTEIKINHLSSLVILDCSNNNLSGLNLMPAKGSGAPGCVSLTSLNCSNNNLQRLEIKVSKDLAEVDYTGNSYLKFTGSSPNVFLADGLDMDCLTIMGDDIGDDEE